MLTFALCSRKKKNDDGAKLFLSVLYESLFCRVAKSVGCRRFGLNNYHIYNLAKKTYVRKRRSRVGWVSHRFIVVA